MIAVPDSVSALPLPTISTDYPSAIADASIYTIPGLGSACGSAGKCVTRVCSSGHVGRVPVRCGRLTCPSCWILATVSAASKRSDRLREVCRRLGRTHVRHDVWSPPPTVTDDEWFRDRIDRDGSIRAADLRTRARYWLDLAMVGVPYGQRIDGSNLDRQRRQAMIAQARRDGAEARRRLAAGIPLRDFVRAVSGGALLFHPFRRIERIGKPPDGTPAWQWARQGTWYWAPHYHYLGFGYLLGDVIRDARLDGWVIKGRPSRPVADIFKTMLYISGHASVVAEESRRG